MADCFLESQVHILMCIYMFGSLAIVCDDYFVASLEYICDGLFILFHFKKDQDSCVFLSGHLIRGL